MRRVRGMAHRLASVHREAAGKTVLAWSRVWCFASAARQCSNFTGLPNLKKIKVGGTHTTYHFLAVNLPLSKRYPTPPEVTWPGLGEGPDRPKSGLGRPESAPCIAGVET